MGRTVFGGSGRTGVSGLLRVILRTERNPFGPVYGRECIRSEIRVHQKSDSKPEIHMGALATGE